MDTLGGAFPALVAILTVITIAVLIAYRSRRDAEPWRDRGDGGGGGD